MRYFCLFLFFFIISCEAPQKRRDRFFLMGNLALEDGAYEKAIDLYDQSLKADPDFSAAINNRGVARMESNHPHEAILDYNQAILKTPGYVDALFNRAYAYEAIGQYDNALDDVLEIETMKPDSAFVYFYKGLIQTMMKDYVGALMSFNRSNILSPYNPETLINIATIYYFEGRYDTAKALIEEVLSLSPNDPNAYNLSSLIKLGSRDFLTALTEINRALDEVPDEPYFLNNRGFIYLEMDSLALALKDINRSIILNPMNGWAYRNKGIYHLKQKEYPDAIRLLQRAIDAGEFIDEMYSYLGEAYYRSGQKDLACSAWKQGEKLNEKQSKEYLLKRCIR